MDFEYSPKVKDLQARLTRFMEERIVPRDLAFHQQADAGQFPPDFYWDLKNAAMEEGLWNMFLPGLKDDEPGTRCSNIEYAPLAEIMGRIYWSPEIFNCLGD